MHLMTIGVLTASVMAGACSRPNAAVTSAPVAAATNAPAAAPSSAPAAAPAPETARPPAESPAVTASMAGTAAAVTPAASGAEAASPATREVMLPAGTSLPIVLDTAIGSDISQVEQPVAAHLSRAVVVRGQTVLPQGSRVTGVVTDATRSGKVKGRAHVAVRFDTVVPRGEDVRYHIQTGPIGRMAPATKKKDALEIGAPAAGGAIIGALVGGKKGALIGGAAGGGAGTAVVLSTRGKEVRLGRGAAMTLRLAAPVRVRVRG